MTRKLSKGDRVSWRSHGSTAEGEVEDVLTQDQEAAGRQVRASDEELQYLVRNDKSGRAAVHKPEALHKKKHKSCP